MDFQAVNHLNGNPGFSSGTFRQSHFIAWLGVTAGFSRKLLSGQSGGVILPIIRYGSSKISRENKDTLQRRWKLNALVCAGFQFYLYIKIFTKFDGGHIFLLVVYR